MYDQQIEEGADIKKSCQWLEKAHLNDSREALIVAAQKQTHKSITAEIWESWCLRSRKTGQSYEFGQLWQKQKHDGQTTGSEILQNGSSCGACLVCSGQYLSNVIQRTNSDQWRGHGRPRLINAHGECHRWPLPSSATQWERRGAVDQLQVSDHQVQKRSKWCTVPTAVLHRP